MRGITVLCFLLVVLVLAQYCLPSTEADARSYLDAEAERWEPALRAINEVWDEGTELGRAVGIAESMVDYLMSLEGHPGLKDDVLHDYWLAAVELWSRIAETARALVSGSSIMVSDAAQEEDAAWDLLEVRELDIIYKYDGYPESKDTRATVALMLIVGGFGAWSAVLAFKEWRTRRAWRT